MLTLNVIKVIKSMRMSRVWYVARMGAMRNAYNILDEKPEGKRPLGRPRRRWEDDIRIALREGEDWMDLAEDRDQWRAFTNRITYLGFHKW
jgi:hypothetical protein